MGDRPEICLLQDFAISLRRDVHKSAGFSIFLKATDFERVNENGCWSILTLDTLDDVVSVFLEENNPPIVTLFLL